MADSIRVTLTPDRMTVQPDSDPLESMITIQNAGATVDQYAVELDQLPTTWYTLSNTSVALFPQDKEEAKLLIHPPKGGGTKAGTYPFTVTVLSRADPTQTTRAEGTLLIGAVAAFDMAMSPTKVTGKKGKYTLTLRNGGNADIEVGLEAVDAEENCRYSFHPKQVQLGPGAKQQVKLGVKARRSSLVGPKKSFDFQIKATPSRGEVKSVPGQLAHQPTFRTGRPIRRLLLLLVLLLVLLGGFLALSRSGGPGSVSGHLPGPVATLVCGHLSSLCSKLSTPGPNGTPGVGGTPVSTPIGAPPAAGPLAFVFAFKEFHDHARSVVGDPLINESTNNGIATQQTTKGMLLYDRKSGHVFLFGNDQTVWEYYKGVTQQVR